ncbi:putative isomerase YbhE [Athelia psychrophila]|uniref:Isomerase YbhE n=1 Tax=Athelia psychrophila TaxID=1759441 RepID=A0A166TFG7_9AGAM|nr:putative isomerase YbhE [Fibularhizoctonia sp. CBS 109695]
MVNFTVIAGGYTSFVASYLFNSDTNTVSLLGNYTTGPDPSWIIPHPTNTSILYATNEDDSGAVQSFTVTPDGVVSKALDTVPSGGSSPAFGAPLPIGGQFAVVNYNSGTGLIIPTTTDPLTFATNATLITFPPPAGGVSHPHMALQHGNETFVTDLGADKVWRLSEAPGGDPGHWAIHGFIQQPKGSGPRHMAIYNAELYIIHELSSTLTVQAIPAFPNGTSTLLGNVSIIPPNPPVGSLFAGGEILIPAPSAAFPTPYIYVSNRNTGTQDPRGDAINVYQRTPGSVPLTLVAQVYTGLDQIRGMQFGREDNGGDAYLMAGGVAGTAGVVVLKRTKGGAGLEIVANNTQIPTRTSFVWL